MTTQGRLYYRALATSLPLQYSHCGPGHQPSPPAWAPVWSPKWSLCFHPAPTIVRPQRSSHSDPFKAQIRSSHLALTSITFGGPTWTGSLISPLTSFPTALPLTHFTPFPLASLVKAEHAPAFRIFSSCIPTSQ